MSTKKDNFFKWEEKDFSEWAEKRLKEMLNWTHAITAARYVEFTNARVEGDAVKYNVKNKIRVQFNFSIRVDFRVIEKNFTWNDMAGVMWLKPSSEYVQEQWEYKRDIRSVSNIPKDIMNKVNEFLTPDILIGRFRDFLREYEAKMDL